MSNLRKLAIALLDTEDGISEEAWTTLSEMLAEGDENAWDIIKLVDATDGRFYLKHEAAEELRKA